MRRDWVKSRIWKACGVVLSLCMIVGSVNVALTHSGSDGVFSDVVAAADTDGSQDDTAVHSNHKICNDNTYYNHDTALEGGCSHEDIEWQPWESSNSLPDKAGYYYLAQTVKLPEDAESWEPEDGTVLCLNGKLLESKSANDLIKVNGTFTLTNCCKESGWLDSLGSRAVNVAESGKFYVYGGELTGHIAYDNGAGVYNSGYVEMCGGSIVACSLAADTGCTEIYMGSGVYNCGTFNLYGGGIIENTTIMRGAGVANVGIFNMYAGTEISRNETWSSKNACHGGGVYMCGEGAVLNMYGGDIADNKSFYSGGGVYMFAGSTFNMYDGNISGNNTYENGGGVYLYEKGTVFNMYNGIIKGNQSFKSGAGVTLGFGGDREDRECYFNMKGGSITENSSYGKDTKGVSYAGAGISSVGHFTFSGGVVKGNVDVKGNVTDMYTFDNGDAKITGVLDDDDEIYVVRNENVKTEPLVVFTSEEGGYQITESDAEHVHVSGTAAFEVQYDVENHRVLVAKKEEKDNSSNGNTEQETTTASKEQETTTTTAAEKETTTASKEQETTTTTAVEKETTTASKEQETTTAAEKETTTVAEPTSAASTEGTTTAAATTTTTAAATVAQTTTAASKTTSTTSETTSVTKTQTTTAANRTTSATIRTTSAANRTSVQTTAAAAGILTADDIPGASVVQIDNTDFAQMGASSESTEKITDMTGSTGTVPDSVQVAAGTENVNEAVLNDIANDSNDTISVLASESAAISAQVINALKDSGKTLSVGIVGDSGKVNAIVTLDSDKLTNATRDFSLKIVTDVVSESVAKAANSRGISSESYDVIDFSYSGVLPGAFKISVNVADRFTDGTRLALYYNNQTTGQLENQYQLTTVSDGYAEFTIDHCSQYVLVSVDAVGSSIVESTISSPKTGDTAKIIFWLMLMAVAVFVGFGLQAVKADKNCK